MEVVRYLRGGSAEVLLRREVPFWRRCLRAAGRAAAHCFRGRSAPVCGTADSPEPCEPTLTDGTDSCLMTCD